MYALISGGDIQAVRNPGRWEYKLSDGAELSPPRTGWTDELAALCGFVPIVEQPRPADTPTTTHDSDVVLIEGVPTRAWTERAKTQAELDAEAAAALFASREGNLAGAIATLRQWADDAEATTATSGNAVAVLNTVLDRLGVFFDRFADLLENR